LVSFRIFARVARETECSVESWSSRSATENFMERWYESDLHDREKAERPKAEQGRAENSVSTSL